MDDEEWWNAEQAWLDQEEVRANRREPLPWQSRCVQCGTIETPEPTEDGDEEEYLCDKCKKEWM
jgi:hypothetical protein